MEKKLKDAVDSLNKKFGKGTLMKMDGDISSMVPTIGTGSIALDKALGGGIAEGRIIEIFGMESCGKTTLCLSVCAQLQRDREDAHVFFVDAEHALNPEWAETIGVDMSRFTLTQPGCGEEAMQIVEGLVDGGAPLIIVDSVAALVPKAELDGEMGQAHVGLQSRLMSQAMRKLTGKCQSNKSTVIFINQIRQKVGISYGNPNTTSGGLALKFYASQRLEISKSPIKASGDEVIGQRTKVKIPKNKIAPPLKKAEFDIYFDCGLSRESEIIDIAKDMKIIEGSSWLKYNGSNLGQGKAQTIQFLKDNPEVAAEIEVAIHGEKGGGEAK